MRYTQSPDTVVHGGTGHQMHSDTNPIPSVVSADDVNMLIWEAMAILEAAGIAGVAFNPNNPATYSQVLQALNQLFITPVELESYAPSATQTLQGLVELANQAEANALADFTRALTPGVLGPVLATVASGATVALKASATGLNGSVTVSAESVFLRSAGVGFEVVRNFAATSNVAAILDAGVLAANTWYALYVVSDGVTPQLRCSTSFTAPTLSGGYTKWAFVSAFRTDGSANKNPLGFTQVGWKVRYRIDPASNVPQRPLMAAGLLGSISIPTYVAVSVGPFVPPNAGVITLVLDGSNSTTLAAPNPNYGSYTSANKPPLGYSLTASATNGASVLGELVLESSNIYYAADSSLGAMSCYGWEFNR